MRAIVDAIEATAMRRGKRKDGVAFEAAASCAVNDDDDKES